MTWRMGRWVLHNLYYSPHFGVGLCEKLMRLPWFGFRKAGICYKETCVLSMTIKLS